MLARVACGALVVMLLATATAGAQDPTRAQLRVEASRPPQNLDDMVRLLPGDTARVRSEFEVVVPPGAFCVTPTVEVKYGVKGPEYASARVFPESQRIEWRPSALAPVAIGYERITGFSTTLEVTFHENAPAFWASEFQVYTMAMPGAAGPACNWMPSPLYHLSFLLVPDYKPGFEVDIPDPHWSSEYGFFDVVNRANGQSQFSFELETRGGTWAEHGSLVLETVAFHGSRAAATGRAIINGPLAPPDWTGRVKITQRSVQPLDELRIAQDIISLGPPPPFTPSPSPAPDDETGMAYDGEVPSVPGWGMMGTVAACGLVGLLRRRP